MLNTTLMEIMSTLLFYLLCLLAKFYTYITSVGHNFYYKFKTELLLLAVWDYHELCWFFVDPEDPHPLLQADSEDPQPVFDIQHEENISEQIDKEAPDAQEEDTSCHLRIATNFCGPELSESEDSCAQFQSSFAMVKGSVPVRSKIILCFLIILVFTVCSIACPVPSEVEFLTPPTRANTFTLVECQRPANSFIICQNIFWRVGMHYIESDDEYSISSNRRLCISHLSFYLPLVLSNTEIQCDIEIEINGTVSICNGGTVTVPELKDPYENYSVSVRSLDSNSSTTLEHSLQERNHSSMEIDDTNVTVEFNDTEDKSFGISNGILAPIAVVGVAMIPVGTFLIVLVVFWRRQHRSSKKFLCSDNNNIPDVIVDMSGENVKKEGTQPEENFVDETKLVDSLAHSTHDNEVNHADNISTLGDSGQSISSEPVAINEEEHTLEKPPKESNQIKFEDSIEATGLSADGMTKCKQKLPRREPVKANLRSSESNEEQNTTEELTDFQEQSIGSSNSMHKEDNSKPLDKNVTFNVSPHLENSLGVFLALTESEAEVGELKFRS